MKKIIAVILTLCFLCSAVGINFYGVTAIEPNEVKTGIVYDFTDSANLSKAITAFGNTQTSFDDKMKVMKVSAIDAQNPNPMQFVVEPKNDNISVTQYPVIAIRLKVTNPNMQYVGTWFESTEMAGGKERYSWWCCSKTDQSYNGTTKWQTIIVDTSDYYNSSTWSNRSFKGNWYSTAFKLAADSTASASDCTYVQWVGLFASVLDANTYAELNSLDEPQVQPGILYDFTRENNAEKAIPAYTNTNVSYDGEKSLLKVEPKNYQDANPMQFVVEPFKTASGVSVKDYPVVALRVKVTNPNTSFVGCWFNGTGLATGENSNSWWTCSITGQKYSGSIRWQTIIIDTSSYYSASWPNRCFFENWYSIAFKLAADGSIGESDCAYVQWVGVFANTADANTYSDEHNLDKKSSLVEPGLVYDFTVGGNAKNALVSNGNTAVQFDTSVEALKVTALDNSAANPMQIVVQPTETVSVSDYPVLAIRLKRPCAGAQYAGTYFNGTGLGQGETYNSWWTCSDINNEYTDTDLWQTLIIDTSNYYNDKTWPNRCFFENWYSMAFKLAKDGTVGQDSAAYVQWIGVFASVNDAVQYGIDYSYNETNEPDYSLNTAFEDKNTFKVGTKIDNGIMFGFNSADDVKLLMSDMKSNLSYDAQSNALKIQVSEFGASKNGRTSAYWNTGFDNRPIEFPDFSVNDYSVMVMRVKYSEGAKGTSMSLPATVKTDKGYTANWTDANVKSGWIASTDWQYVYFTFDKNTYSTVSGLYIDPLRNSVLGEYALVDFVAVFTDMSAARAFTGEVAGKNTENEYNSPFFFSYETKQDYLDDLGNGSLQMTNNAYGEWNETEQALKVTPNKPNIENSFTLRFNALKDNYVKEYPVYAALVKVSDTSKIQLGDMYFNTDYYMQNRPATMTNTFNKWSNTFSEYKKTSDWQVIYWDTAEEVSKWWQGKLNSSLLVLAAQNYIAAPSDNIFVKFYGAFKSVDDVYKYASRYGKFSRTSGGGVEGLSELFIDFKSESDVAKIQQSDNNTALSYDAKQRAMKIDAIDVNEKYPCKIRLTPRVSVKVSEYPVLAFRLKVLQDNLQFGALAWRTSTYAKIYDENVSKGLKMNWFTNFKGLSVRYEKTTDWQTVIIDGSNYANNYFDGSWTDIIIQLLPMTNSNLIKGNSFYMDWIGAFDSTGSVYKFCGMSVAGDKDAPTDLFFKFSSEQYINANVVALGDTQVSYDSAKKAMKVTVKDTDDDGMVVTTPGKIELGTKSSIKAGLTAENYPFIAMRVKLEKTDTKGGNLYGRTSGTVDMLKTGVLDSSDMLIKELDYKPHDEWQTVIINCLEDDTMSYFFTGDWKKIAAEFVSGDLAIEGTNVFVQWIGGFESYDDIIEYAGEDQPVNLIAKSGSSDKKTVKSSPLRIVIPVAVAAVIVIGGVVGGIVIYRKKKRV